MTSALAWDSVPVAEDLRDRQGLRLEELTVDDLGLIGQIDRTEHVDIEYEVVEGQIVERPVTFAEVPAWDPTGTGPHSVAGQIDFCASVLADGGVFLGAFDGARFVGLAVVDPEFGHRMAWLAFLHVNRADRRRGVAQLLWDAAAERARAAGSRTMYVSATPTGSAVGFYLRQGCALADPVHPRLHADEPEDVHLTCPLADPEGV
jgi:ribosomal protein S18 acetylase RimI-like enzyme